MEYVDPSERAPYRAPRRPSPLEWVPIETVIDEDVDDWDEPKAST